MPANKNALIRYKTIDIVYQTFSAQEPQEYILCPYLLKEFRNRWFLFGSRASDLVLFNLAQDRIVRVEPADVPYCENPDFNSEHFFDDVIGVSKGVGKTPRRISFWGSRKQSQYIMTKPVHHSQKLMQRNEDGGCIFEIEVVINFEMYSVFMSYGPGVKIISPPEACAFMRDRLREASSLYDEDA